LGVKLPIWLPTIKSQESPRFPCVQVACDIPLESSQQGIQLCFKPHFNRRFARKVMSPPSHESPNYGNFGTPKTKWHLGVGPVARHRIYYKGKGGGFPQVRGCGESCESEFACGSFVHQKCSSYALTNLLFGLCKSMWMIELLINLPNPLPELQHAPLSPKCYELRSAPQPFSPSVVFTFGLAIKSIEELGGASLGMVFKGKNLNVDGSTCCKDNVTPFSLKLIKNPTHFWIKFNPIKWIILDIFPCFLDSLNSIQLYLTFDEEETQKKLHIISWHLDLNKKSLIDKFLKVQILNQFLGKRFG